MTFLRFDRVTHHYFSEKSVTKSLADVSFSVKEGEFLSIIGPSGCGKSTILSLIAGLLKETRGEITIENEALEKRSTKVGYMLQQDYLFPWKTIMDNILLGPKITNKIDDKTIQRAQDLLKEVQLSHIANHYPSQLSGGMRQRIALVRTLMTDPEILLFDEPFSALDYVTKLQLENVISHLMKTYKKTAILVTHDLSEAISMSDRIILMDPSPGRVKKIFQVPESLRESKPFYVRRHQAFQALFDEVWKEFNTEEKRESL